MGRLNIEPQKLLTLPETIERIEKSCQRQFSDENLRQECILFVIDRLRESDYRRIRSFKGHSKLQTYLYTVINRQVIEFRRKKFGRRRFPKMVSRLGKWAEKVYRLLCWERYSVLDAFEILFLEKDIQGSYEEFLTKIQPLNEAKCPENPQFISLEGMSDVKGYSPPDSDNPLDLLIDKIDRNRRKTAIDILKEMVADLSERDQLLVRLVYGSGHTAAAASRVIGVSERTGRKRLKSLLVRLRQALLKKGIRES